MLGAVAGDIIGSQYEFDMSQTYDFELLNDESFFTDDTVMTLAVARWLMETSLSSDELINSMKELGRQYPFAGYGSGFNNWIWSENPKPYNSYGNGSAMRVSPVGLYAHDMQETLELAYITAAVSHNHPEGIKGAQSTAAAVYMAKNGYTKEQIREVLTALFGYRLDTSLEQLRPTYHWSSDCQQSVPEAILCFLEGGDFEDSVRLAVSLRGDADTQASIAGSIAACMYPIPEDIALKCKKCLTQDLRRIMNDFEKFIDER